MDVKNTFLNGGLEGAIYMKQPPGYISPGLQAKVCRLFKTIYGLKQSSRRWYQKLSHAFLKMGFVVCPVEHGVFYKPDSAGISIISVSVDDLSIFSDTIDGILAMKAALNDAFEMTDLGEIHWLLSIEIKCDREARTISLSQRVYIDTILSCFNLESANPLSTPTDPNTHLSAL